MPDIDSRATESDTRPRANAQVSLTLRKNGSYNGLPIAELQRFSTLGTTLA
jgi:hypothetical protein